MFSVRRLRRVPAALTSARDPTRPVGGRDRGSSPTGGRLPEKAGVAVCGRAKSAPVRNCSGQGSRACATSPIPSGRRRRRPDPATLVEDVCDRHETSPDRPHRAPAPPSSTARPRPRPPVPGRPDPGGMHAPLPHPVRVHGRRPLVVVAVVLVALVSLARPAGAVGAPVDPVPVGVWPLAADARGGAGLRPAGHALGRRSSRGGPRRHRRPGRARRARRSGHVRRPARRARRRGRRPRHHPHHLRAGRRQRPRRRRGRPGAADRHPRARPAPTASRAPASTGGGGAARPTSTRCCSSAAVRSCCSRCGATAAPVSRRCSRRRRSARLAGGADTGPAPTSEPRRRSPARRRSPERAPCRGPVSRTLGQRVRRDAAAGTLWPRRQARGCAWR